MRGKGAYPTSPTSDQSNLSENFDAPAVTWTCTSRLLVWCATITLKHQGADTRHNSHTCPHPGPDMGTDINHWAWQPYNWWEVKQHSLISRDISIHERQGGIPHIPYIRSIKLLWKVWCASQDLNQCLQIASLVCYHYTTTPRFRHQAQ